MNDLIVDLEWQEDDLVVQLVHRYGPKKWTLIAKHLNGRIGKQCRERWHNHLDPNINKSPWTEEEDRLLAQAHDQFGNQWAKIAKLLPGRYRPHSTPFHFTVLFLFNCCFAIWTILVEILYVFFSNLLFYLFFFSGGPFNRCFEIQVEVFKYRNLICFWKIPELEYLMNLICPKKSRIKNVDSCSMSKRIWSIELKMDCS